MLTTKPAMTMVLISFKIERGIVQLNLILILINSVEKMAWTSIVVNLMLERR